MKDVRSFWSVEPDNDGFDPVKFPEIKPYLATSPDDDEIGLRHLHEWPESLAAMSPPRHRERHRRQRAVRPRRRAWS